MGRFMKKLNEYSNYFGFVLVLCAIVVSGCSCATTKQDPLAGWQKDYGKPDQLIVNDCQNYIQSLLPEEKKYVGPYGFFRDDTGQHAVQIEVDKNGKDVWNHYLFYDRDNKRIKVITKYMGQYWNP